MARFGYIKAPNSPKVFVPSFSFLLVASRERTIVFHHMKVCLSNTQATHAFMFFNWRPDEGSTDAFQLSCKFIILDFKFQCIFDCIVTYIYYYYMVNKTVPVLLYTYLPMSLWICTANEFKSDKFCTFRNLRQCLGKVL